MAKLENSTMTLSTAWKLGGVIAVILSSLLVFAEKRFATVGEVQAVKVTVTDNESTIREIDKKTDDIAEGVAWIRGKMEGK